MTQRPPPGVCAYCGGEFADLTWDHVFPEAWYPSSKPDNQELWKVPACEPCNTKYGRVERRVFQELALGTDPWVPASAGISEKAQRAMDPAAGKSPKDSEARDATRTRILGASQRTEDLTGTVLPNIGRLHDPEPAGYLVLSVDPTNIAVFLGKLTRGISFLTLGRPIPELYEVKFFQPTENAKLMEFVVGEGGRPALFSNPPALYVERYPVTGDDMAAVYRFFIWDRFEFVTIVGRQDTAETAKDA